MRRRGAIERDWAGGGYSSVSGEPGVAGPARRRRRWGPSAWLSGGPRPCRPVSPERDRDRVRL